MKRGYTIPPLFSMEICESCLLYAMSDSACGLGQRLSRRKVILCYCPRDQTYRAFITKAKKLSMFFFLNLRFLH